MCLSRFGRESSVRRATIARFACGREVCCWGLAGEAAGSVWLAEATTAHLAGGFSFGACRRGGWSCCGWLCRGWHGATAGDDVGDDPLGRLIELGCLDPCRNMNGKLVDC